MAESNATGAMYLETALKTYRSYKRMAENAVEQLGDDALHMALDENTNAIIVIMKHIAGNFRSRWTDFLASDGEKPWRNRDTEFIDDIDRAALMKAWETGWKVCLDTLDALRPSDLSRAVTIRGERYTVLGAIERNLTHAAYHVGQIVILARHLAGDDWEVMTIPKGRSEEFNRKVWKR